MDDVRWFAPNRYCALPVARLREAGLRVAVDGEAPARLAVATDGTCAVQAYRYAWRHRLPLLVYLWDLPPWQLDGGSPNPIVSIRGRIVKIPRVFGTYPERNGYYSRVCYAARHATAVWAPSAASKLEVERRFGVEVEQVPFCFDSDRFNRGAGWRKPDRATVLSISRLVPYKNHAAVIRAAAMVVPRPRVHIIGRGPQGPNLRELGRQAGVELLLDESWQTDEQIVDAYREASVVVCPSRFEGIGLTPLEGAAIGVPTIASDIPTHREFASSHVTLIPLDDDERMAEEVDRALRQDVTVVPDPRHPFPGLTIEACAARFLARIETLLQSA